MKMVVAGITLAGYLLAFPVGAELQRENIHYQNQDTELEGYLVRDDQYKGKRPGILMVHEWWGLNKFVRSRADQLATEGYVVFAADMYGKGRVTRHPDQASTWMKEVLANSTQWVDRANSALSILKAQSSVDEQQTAAIGYCFGGATVMKMAYSGSDVDLVASFHGSLPVATGQELDNIRTRILVAHGNADPFVSLEQVDAFRQALEKSGADWTMMEFGGVKHSFTNPDAADYGIEALAYDRQADAQSWEMLLWQLNDVFNPKK